MPRFLLVEIKWRYWKITDITLADTLASYGILLGFRKTKMSKIAFMIPVTA